MKAKVKNLLVSGKLFKIKPVPTVEEADEAYQAALAARARAAHFLAQARLRFEEAEQAVERTEDTLTQLTGSVN